MGRRLACLMMLVALAGLLPALAAGAQGAEVSTASQDFGDVAVGDAATFQLTLSNTGNTVIAIGSLFVNDTDGPGTFSNIEKGTCYDPGGTLDPGASCTAVIQFEPAAEGASAGSVDITFSDVDAVVFDAVSVALSGNGVAAGAAVGGGGGVGGGGAGGGGAGGDGYGPGGPPRVAAVISPSALDYGAVPVGASRTLTLKVTNAGNLPLEGVYAAIGDLAGNGYAYWDNGDTGPAAFRFEQTGSCRVTSHLDPDESCTIDLTFAVSPSAASLLGSGEVRRISVLTRYGGAFTAGLVTVAGTVGGTAAFRAITNSTDFGRVAVGQSATRVVVVTNLGSVPLYAAGLEFTGPAASTFRAMESTCYAGALAPGEACEITVGFTAASSDAATAGFNITFNHGAVPELAHLEFRANFGAIGVTLVSGNEYFGTATIGMAVRHTFTFRNTGTASLDGRPYLQGLDQTIGFEVTGGTCGTQRIDPGETCTVDVTFRPTRSRAETGIFNVSFVVPASSGNVLTQVALHGTGVAVGFDPVFLWRIGPDPLDFGRVAAGTARTLPLTLTNVGRSSYVVATPTLRLASGGGAFTVPGTGTCLTPTTGATGPTGWSVGAVLPVSAIRLAGTAAASAATPAIPPGGTCTIDVTFTPRDARDTRADFTIGANGDPLSPIAFLIGNTAPQEFTAAPAASSPESSSAPVQGPVQGGSSGGATVATAVTRRPVQATVSAAPHIWALQRRTFSFLVEANTVGIVKAQLYRPGSRSHVTEWKAFPIQPGSLVRRFQLPSRKLVGRFELRAVVQTPRGRITRRRIVEFLPAPWRPAGRPIVVRVNGPDDHVALAKSLAAAYRVGHYASPGIAIPFVAIPKVAAAAAVIDLTRTPRRFDDRIGLVRNLRWIFPDLRLVVITGNKRFAALATKWGADGIVAPGTDAAGLKAALDTALAHQTGRAPAGRG